MIWFAIASVTPAALLALACLYGGPFPLLSLLSITVVVFFADKIGRRATVSDDTGRWLNLALAAVHFCVLILGVTALTGNDTLPLIDKLLIYTTLGLFCGQVSNSNAHELIHASARLPRRIGAAVYISLLHGHHVSAHLRVHHIHAATDADPNSARPGEGFWAYALRAVSGEFLAGLRADNAHLSRRADATSRLRHPYVFYVLGGVFCLSAAATLGGIKAVLIYLAVVVYAQMQLLLSDYVQHYGLRRRLTSAGKPEPMGPQHSWNAPKWYSSAMMLNAPRHSDHHIRPARPFPALEVDAQLMPILPHSLPVMAVLALIPPLWRRIMDRRLHRWQTSAADPAPSGQGAALLQH